MMSVPQFRRTYAHLLRGNQTLLFVAILSLFIAYPFVGGMLKDYGLVDARFFILLLIAFCSVGLHRRHLLNMTLFAAAFLAIEWVALEGENTSVYLARQSLGAAVFLYAAIAICWRVAREERISFHTISGSLCVYLMIGAVFALLFSMIEEIHPGSFEWPDTDKIETQGQKFSMLLYFSYTTLTTIGYGDCAPVNPNARALAILEGLLGQIYLVVLVARIVGLHISQSIEEQARKSAASSG
ncbi:MAG: ion channel [Planctomycetota bacterium]